MLQTFWFMLTQPQSMFPLIFLRCTWNRTVSEQPILMPEHFQVSHFRKRQLKSKINMLLQTRVDPMLLIYYEVKTVVTILCEQTIVDFSQT